MREEAADVVSASCRLAWGKKLKWAGEMSHGMKEKAGVHGVVQAFAWGKEKQSNSMHVGATKEENKWEKAAVC